MDTTTLSEKGAIQIPLHLRKWYGLKKGDRIRFIDYGGVISLVPASDSAINDLFGSMKGETSLVQALLESRRREADPDRLNNS